MKKNILAEGEMTGHYHEAIGDGVDFDKEERLLTVPITATVIHQEHQPINLEKGKYDIIKVREYDHWLEETRKILD